MSREIMQQALDVIIELYNERGEVCEQNKNLFVEADETIKALEAELAKPEQLRNQTPHEQQLMNGQSSLMRIK